MKLVEFSKKNDGKNLTMIFLCLVFIQKHVFTIFLAIEEVFEIFVIEKISKKTEEKKQI